MAGLHRVQDAELPMQTSDFYSRCMLACKPTGQSLWTRRGTTCAAMSTCCPALLQSGCLWVTSCHVKARCVMSLCRSGSMMLVHQPETAVLPALPAAVPVAACLQKLCWT